MTEDQQEAAMDLLQSWYSNEVECASEHGTYPKEEAAIGARAHDYAVRLGLDDSDEEWMVKD